MQDVVASIQRDLRRSLSMGNKQAQRVAMHNLQVGGGALRAGALVALFFTYGAVQI